MARAKVAKEIKAKRATLRGENMTTVSCESKTKRLKGVGATEAWGNKQNDLWGIL